MDNNKHQIFQTLEWANRQLGNRLAVSPMSRVSATADGSATEEMADYYAAFAKGGFSMIITEGIYTDQLASKSYPHQPGIVTTEHIAAWQQVSARVKAHPSIFIAQLMHGGAISQYSDQTLAPSAIQPAGIKMVQYGGSGGFPLPVEMSGKDIEDAIAGFVNSAKAAYEAGFHGIELHAANGYLLDQFLTPELNIREDHYGGSTRNRFRIIAEIISGIRAALPESFLVGIRLSEAKVNDMGYRWQQGAAMAIEVLEEVKRASPDFVHIAVQSGEWERDSFYSDGSSYASLAKQITGKLVIANGGMHDLKRAATAIDGAHADLLSIGKAALAEPDWPQRTLQGAYCLEFDRDMLWPEATIGNSRKVITSLQKKQPA